MTREDFCFTIGYEGMNAIVDAKAKARYGRLSTVQLAEKGLYRAAFASALYNGDDSEFQAFAALYNANAGTALRTVDDFRRLFGVNKETVKRVQLL